MSDVDEQSVRGRRWVWWLVSLVGVGCVLTLAALSFALRLLETDEARVQIADVSSERLLALGSVVGFAAEHETHAWLGIPYARTPTGELRWRAPRPPEAWADTLDALDFASPCVQLGSPLGGVPTDEPGDFAGEEDCLYLNIWAPRSEADAVPSGAARLPVMVWIHGGGNRIGHAGLPMYDGARLAGRENVVVVSFNYRLGPFGWFAHAALRSEASDGLEASGNFGTLDQIRALQWIASHIEEFGGDPGNVTIFGESAGGTNVLALLLAEPARGLFHRAISQSGSTDSVSRAAAENALVPAAGAVPGQRHSSAESIVSLLEQAGIVPDREAARRYAADLPDPDLRSFLRERSAREILDVYRRPERPVDLEVPRLIRDGSLLPTGDWLAEFRAGRFSRVPVMLGSNRDEWKLFISQDDAHVRRRLGIFYRIRDPADYERRARHHSDLWAVRAVSGPASAIGHAGQRDVFAYRFDWDELPRLLGFGVDLSRLLGAAHALEVPFVFGVFDLGDPLFNRVVWSDETARSRERLGNQMMGYWAEFARTGHPGRGGREHWPEWKPWIGEDGRAATVLVFDSEAAGGIRIGESNVSRDHVIAAIDSEPELDQNQKCALFLDLFGSRPGFRIEEYRRIGRRGCADFPAEVH